MFHTFRDADLLQRGPAAPPRIQDQFRPEAVVDLVKPVHCIDASVMKLFLKLCAIVGAAGGAAIALFVTMFSKSPIVEQVTVRSSELKRRQSSARRGTSETTVSTFSYG